MDAIAKQRGLRERIATQPFCGIIATVAMLGLALAFAALFEFHTFTTWVGFLLLCTTPAQLVISIHGGARYPAFAARAPQPLQGIHFTLATVLIAAAAAAAALRLVGGGVTPPTPVALHFAIFAIVTTLWLVAVWQGWPVTLLTASPLGAGVAILVLSYAVAFVLFRVLFDYGFMAQAPVYVAAIDPRGAFNAWQVLVFGVTTLAAILLIVCFELWPMTRFPRIMRQPLLGLVFSLYALLIAAILRAACVDGLGMDVVEFLVAVPIAFIIGAIIVLNMLQQSLYRRTPQPLKGVLLAATSAAVGGTTYWLYATLATVIAGPLASGPPAYALQIWIATAILSVALPFLLTALDYFKLWPLVRPRADE
jgi:hypothetical protein